MFIIYVLNQMFLVFIFYKLFKFDILQAWSLIQAFIYVHIQYLQIILS